MIIGIIHKGSGLGDQLFSYIATRVRALDLGVDFGFVGKEFFKGFSFMNLDWGKETKMAYTVIDSSGQVVPVKNDFHKDFKIIELNKPYYDPEFNFIPDGSIIDGYGAQDQRYFEHRINQINQWLKVESLDMSNKVNIDVCVINFRGGEYALYPNLFLRKHYWQDAVYKIQNNPKFFEVHTDDLELAQKTFPKWKCVRDIGLNWRSLRFAKNAIISNSAFAIIPRLLKHFEDPEAITIAPRGWANRNNFDGNWQRPGNYYKNFIYI